jgi:hypothetical protein
MNELTDEQIQSNYLFRGRNRIDSFDGEGESLNCDRCRRHSDAPGTGQTALARLPKRGPGLPPSLELCDDCAKALGYQ